MKRNFWTQQVPVILLVSGMVLTTAAFQNKPSQQTQNTTDTIPGREKKIRSIDDALEELERSKVEMNRAFKEIDFDKLEKEISESTRKMQLDMEKMQSELAQSLKEIDGAKIQADVQKALKDLDLANMQADMKELKGIDFEKMKADIEASVAKVDMKKIHEEMEKVRKVDMEKIKADLENMKPELEKSIKQAHEGMEKAKKELLEYKGFVDGLEKDGLIDKNQSYTIEYKKGELSINGKIQPAEVSNKYSQFLKDRKDFTIKRDQDDFNIDED